MGRVFPKVYFKIVIARYTLILTMSEAVQRLSVERGYDFRDILASVIDGSREVLDLPPLDRDQKRVSPAESRIAHRQRPPSRPGGPPS